MDGAVLDVDVYYLSIFICNISGIILRIIVTILKINVEKITDHKVLLARENRLSDEFELYLDDT